MLIGDDTSATAQRHLRPQAQVGDIAASSAVSTSQHSFQSFLQRVDVGWALSARELPRFEAPPCGEHQHNLYCLSAHNRKITLDVLLPTLLSTSKASAAKQPSFSLDKMPEGAFAEQPPHAAILFNGLCSISVEMLA